MVHESHTKNDVPIHLGQVLKCKKILVCNIFYHFLFAVSLVNKASKMSEKFRLERKIGFQNMFYTKCLNVILNSIGPSIILRSIYVTASRDYQACCSIHVFKLCSETAGMFVTVAPGYLAHRIQACISVRFANTFVVAELCQQVCRLHLPQPAVMSSMLVPDQWAVKYNCTRSSSMFVTEAPDQQPCLYMLNTISMHVSYSFILSASMNVIFAPSHQPCL